MSRTYRPETKYQLMSHVAVVLLLLILTVSVGYYMFLARPDEFAARLEMMEALEAANARWDERAPAEYRYVVDRSCDCPPEIDRAYVVTVDSNGRAAAFPIPVESSAGVVLDAPVTPVWLENIVDDIERTLRSGSDVEARYNYLYGYPEYVDLSPGATRPTAVSQFEIRDFEVIRSDEDSPD
jgi:hypothetical protein